MKITKHILRIASQDERLKANDLRLLITIYLNDFDQCLVDRLAEHGDEGERVSVLRLQILGYL